jgi:hypothetical protein
MRGGGARRERTGRVRMGRGQNQRDQDDLPHGQHQHSEYSIQPGESEKAGLTQGRHNDARDGAG